VRGAAPVHSYATAAGAGGRMGTRDRAPVDRLLTAAAPSRRRDDRCSPSRRWAIVTAADAQQHAHAQLLSRPPTARGDSPGGAQLLRPEHRVRSGDPRCRRLLVGECRRWADGALEIRPSGWRRVRPCRGVARRAHAAGTPDRRRRPGGAAGGGAPSARGSACPPADQAVIRGSRIAPRPNREDGVLRGVWRHRRADGIPTESC
jgi:hypothetical protein